MSNALWYLMRIFSKFINFIFNDAEIFENVSIGWICITILVFRLLISSILNIPRSGSSYRIRSNKDE